MESQTVFQAETQANFFLLNLAPAPEGGEELARPPPGHPRGVWDCWGVPLPRQVRIQRIQVVQESMKLSSKKREWIYITVFIGYCD